MTFWKRESHGEEAKRSVVARDCGKKKINK
jgi:hypothetical protein